MTTILAVLRHPPYGDVGPFEATVGPHAYLSCWVCGRQLLAGTTATGAVILACRGCARIADARRIP